MRDDLRADTVLQRRDDLAPRRVVLGIGREDEADVEVQPDGVAFDLDVPFLHDVEQSDLNLAGQVGQLVDREDPAVGARQQSEVHGQLVGQEVPAARGLDRVHIPDDVRDGDVRCGELLHVAGVAWQPRDGCPVAPLGYQFAPELRDRRERIVVHLAPLQNRNLFIEQGDELPEDTALGLPAQPEQDEIVPGEDGVHELRDDRVFVSHDAREQRRAVLEETDQILPQLVFHGPVNAGGARPLRLFQVAQRGRLGHRAIVNRPPPPM